MRIVLVIVGIFLLVKGKVGITENTELSPKTARVLGLVAFIPSIIAVIIFKLNIGAMKTIMSHLDLAVFIIVMGGIAYLKKPKQKS